EGQVEALRVAEATGLEGFDDAGIVAGVDHDGHVLMIFRGGTHHGRPADVDVLDGVGQRAVRLAHGGRKGVEVDRHQVDRLDAVLGHHRAVQVTTAKNAAVDLRVQGLDPAIHHFRKTGVVGNFHSGNSAVLEQLEGATRGENLDAQGGE